MHASDAIALAARHGLLLDESSVTITEAGLDFRVAMAADTDGVTWVLRIPRRPDVLERADEEARTLDVVRPALAGVGVAVPDWRVRADDLIAYPALPGRPGLTLDAPEPEWHMDPASTDYARPLGRLLAVLHGVSADAARAAGSAVRTPSDGRISGILDWTTAGVDDPARDFAFQVGAGGDEALRATIDAYAEAGGRTWPGLAAQARRIWDASPLAYALFALTTEDPEHRAAAEAMLRPDS